MHEDPAGNIIGRYPEGGKTGCHGPAPILTPFSTAEILTASRSLQAALEAARVMRRIISPLLSH